MPFSLERFQNIKTGLSEEELPKLKGAVSFDPMKLEKQKYGTISEAKPTFTSKFIRPTLQTLGIIPTPPQAEKYAEIEIPWYGLASREEKPYIEPDLTLGKYVKGLFEGTARPEYGKCVSICTTAALKQMILPALLAIAAPLLVGFILGKFALAGFLMGSIAGGFLLAITMANAGGSWDNAKKYIEMGEHGGKGSDAHKAAVVGDTVGDPMKDTSGPSLNIMIKLMAVISLVFAPVIISWDGLI